MAALDGLPVSNGLHVLRYGISISVRASRAPSGDICQLETRLHFFGSALAISSLATITIIMAATKMFPVPLTLMVVMIPNAIAAQLVLAVFNKNTIASSEANIDDYNRRLQTANRLQMVQALPLVIYPVYAAAFSQLDASIQPWFSIVLFGLRHCIRYMQ